MTAALLNQGVDQMLNYPAARPYLRSNFPRLQGTRNLLAISVAVLTALAPLPLLEAHQRGPEPGHATVSHQQSTSKAGTASIESMNVPYFSQSGGMHSVLTLNNNTAHEMKVEITVFNTKGRPLMVPLTLKPGITDYELRDLIKNAKGFGSGNLQLEFEGNSMAVTCQIGVFLDNKRVSFESRDVGMMDFASSQMNSIVWAPDRNSEAFVALTNVASKQVSVDLSIGKHKERISLGPRQTHLFELERQNDLHADGDVDLDGASSRHNKEDGVTARLLNIQHNGMPGDIIGSGFVLNKQSGYSSSFTLIDPATMRSATLAGAHVRFGNAGSTEEGFPANTRFHAPLVLANIGPEPLDAHVSVDYTITGIPATVSVSDVHVLPGQLKTIDLAEELADHGISGPVDDAGVDISHTAAPGSLIAELTSVDQSGDYSFEVPIVDPSDATHMATSSYPWTLEGGTRTVMHLKNTTPRPVWTGIQFLFGEGGVYNPDRFRLEPFQTLAIDIQTLKTSGEKDTLGNAFPQTATRGQLKWFEETPRSMIGRVEYLNIAAGTTRSFSCGNCPCGNRYFRSDLTPSSVTKQAGDQGVFFSPRYWQMDCQDGNIYGPFSYTANPVSWSASGSTATVDSNGRVSCIAGGTSSISATLELSDSFYQGPFLGCSQPTLIHPSTDPSTVMVSPKITGISPAKGLIGTTITVTISGAGFAGSGLSVSAGAGITVTINNSNPSQIQATFTISASTPSGNHGVTVTAGGQTSLGMNFFVQQPSASRIVQQISSIAIDSTTNPSCPSGQVGWFREVKKIVTDQSGADITMDGQGLSELVTIGLPNDLQIRGTVTGNATTNGGGFFFDTYFVCSSRCPASPGSTAATQQIFDTPPSSSARYDLAFVNLSYKCTAITANGQ